MKKKILFVMLLLVLLPLGVFADEVEDTSKFELVQVGKDVLNDDGTSTRTFDAYFYPMDANTEEREVTVKLTTGDGIKSITCTGKSPYDTTTFDDTTKTCVFSVAEGEKGSTGKKILLGQVTAIVKSSGSCAIEYECNGHKGTTNSNTGIETPYVVIALGLALGTAIYLSTKRKATMYKI